MEYKIDEEYMKELDEGHDAEIDEYNALLKKVCPLASWQAYDGDDTVFCEADNRTCRATRVWTYGSLVDFNKLYGSCTRRGDSRDEMPPTQEMNIDDFIERIEKNLGRKTEDIY